MNQGLSNRVPFHGGILRRLRKKVYLQNMEIPLETHTGDSRLYGDSDTSSYLTDWFGKRLRREDIEGMLDNYYEERGWDIQKGVPTKEKLIELGLEEFVKIVESA